MMPKKVRLFARKVLKPSKKLKWRKEPKHGFKNVVYFVSNGGKKYVVKRGIMKDSGMEKRTEFSMLRLLRGESVPQPVAYDSKKNLLIKTFVSGRIKKTVTTQDIMEAAKGLSRLHRTRFRKPGKPFTKRKPSTYQQYFYQQIDLLKDKLEQLTKNPKTQSLGEHLTRLLEKALEQNRQAINGFKGNTFAVINFDLVPKNVLWEGKKPQVIDWGDASIGDPALEIARIFFSWGLKPEQRELFLDKYYGRSKQLEQRISIYERFVRINNIMWEANMFHALQRGEIKPTPQTNINTFEKRFIQHYQEYLFLFESEKVSPKVVKRLLHD